MSISEGVASVAARAFFWPSLGYNIARSRLQETWNWWDDITSTVVLGALPFSSSLEQLKAKGVTAVVTLNEEFEVFITPEQYQEAHITHLHIPTVDFVFAPKLEDLLRGTNFIHSVGEAGGKTYVHCKAGRGRSTTLVLCYLVRYCGFGPEAAYRFVRERRPQVYLAQGQWLAVCAFYLHCHPELQLRPQDFPYPSFAADPAAAAAGEGKAAVEAAPQEQQRQAAIPVPGAAGDGEDASVAGSFEVCGTDGPSSLSTAVQISASAQQTTESDEAVLVGSGGSEASVSGALAALRLRPAGGAAPGGGGAAGMQQRQCPPAADGPELPERAASPAIQIPASAAPRPARSCFAQLGGSPPPSGSGSSVRYECSSKGSAHVEPSASSRGSIQLEPSGSLPGYVRIAPAAPARQAPPVLAATLASTGFQPLEDWAAVEPLSSSGEAPQQREQA